jgi:SAM-dependent methyltransferase
VCLKIPVGAGEEDLIFEYLNLLVSRPEVAKALGARAKDYVARECNWASVAAQYAGFLTSVTNGTPWQDSTSRDGTVKELGDTAAARCPGADSQGYPAMSPGSFTDPEGRGSLEYLEGWAATPEAAGYLNTHQTRLVKTLQITPPGGPEDRILEMGAYLQITPALRSKLSYGEVRGCYYGPAGRVDHRSVTSAAGETFSCEIDLFNAEKDRFPYDDAYFSTVLCCELIEHLFEDPMHLMCEVNRILKPGGHLVLTTPNIASLRGLSGILQGYHPGFFHAYIKPAEGSGEVDARHNREYAPREIHQLLENSGFEVTLLETGEFRDEPHPEFGWIVHLLERYRLGTELRGDGIYAVGRKTGAVKERYPAWLYA